MTELRTFVQCLEGLMESKGLSVTKLATAIGSRTIVRSVLSGGASLPKQMQLLEKIEKTEVFSQRELNELRTAMDVSRTGIEHYRFHRAIERIMTGNATKGLPEMKLQNGQSLRDRLSVLYEAQKIEIICLNCCFPSMFDAFASLFLFRDLDIRFEHYIQLEAFQRAPADLVSSIFPVLFDSRYRPYALERSATESTQIIGGNLLSIKAEIAGNIKEFFFVCISNELIHENIHAQQSCLYSYIEEILRISSAEKTSLKEEPEPSDTLISLSMNFLSHELNRATYALSNDIALHQIPTDIALDSLRESGLFTALELDKMSGDLISIHEQRHKNLYTKKKSAYAIMTIGGCQRFLDTGYTTDHFYGFRAFTVDERRKVFELMLHHARNNPFFTPLLLKNHHMQFCYNMECYEKLGVTIDLKNSNYDIVNGYPSVFVMIPEFTKQYMEYYLRTLVKDKCYGPKESLKQLEKMYNGFLSKHKL